MKKNIKIILKSAVSVTVAVAFFNGCSGQPNLNNAQLLAKSQECFKTTNLASIYNIPSRGLLADGLSLSVLKTTGVAEGFTQSFQSNIASGSKQFVVYSTNNLKSSEYLTNTLSKFSENALQGIELCYIGNKEYSLKIEKEALRVGASYKNIYELNSDK